MKNYLFTIIASFSHLLSQAIKGVAEFLVFVNSETTCLLLRVIDKKRMEHTVSVIEQKGEISELSVLIQIQSVVQDAISKGGWDEEHEGSLNMAANILYNEHDWEEDRIQKYVGNIIDNADVKMESEDD